MPACAPDGTPAGQRRLRETGSGAKTGQEHAPRVRDPVVSRIPEANRAFCSLSLTPLTLSFAHRMLLRRLPEGQRAQDA